MAIPAGGEGEKALNSFVCALPHTSTPIQVDINSTTKFLGWVVAAYSVGQLVASPVLGVWADHRPTWEPLIISLLINVVFSVLYCYAGAFTQQHHTSGWIVLISRALIGFGAGVGIFCLLYPCPPLSTLLPCPAHFPPSLSLGNAAIVRSYVSEATTEKERVGAMAGVSAFQAIGFIAGPGMPLVLSLKSSIPLAFNQCSSGSSICSFGD